MGGSRCVLLVFVLVGGSRCILLAVLQNLTTEELIPGTGKGFFSVLAEGIKRVISKKVLLRQIAILIRN